jgi:hypothetical protein
MIFEDWYDLECRYDSRQSFYGKAKIRVCEKSDKIEHLELLSYGTLVANYVYYKDENKKVYEYFGKYSQTTTRHQKEFFKQLDLSNNEIKELFEKGVLSVINE